VGEGRRIIDESGQRDQSVLEALQSMGIEEPNIENMDHDSGEEQASALN
jgi:hypothetical protein